MSENYNKILDVLKKKQLQKRINKFAQKYKGKDVYLYGAGICFDVIKDNFNLTGLNIVGIGDIKFEDEKEYAGFTTFSPETMAQKNPDVVLITMYEHDVAVDYFEEELFNEFGKFQYEVLVKFSLIDAIKALFKE